MSFDELRERIMNASIKSENRTKKLEDIFDEEFSVFDDKEFRSDIINSILAETLYRNDPMAQEKLRKIRDKYK